MAEELSYVLTTPYTIAKSRTGGILSRLFSRVDLDLVAAQVFTPDRKTVENYAASLMKHSNPNKPGSAELLSQYVLNNMTPSDGRPHRVALFIFRGEDAVSQLMDQVGALYPENRGLESITGETIRDTYADLVRSQDGEIVYFEPALLTPHSRESAKENLLLFNSFIRDKDNIVKNLIHAQPESIEQTLVIIKPDNWRTRSTRPGSIIDMFSRTGLRIVGMKLYQMSASDALEFYGSVQTAIENRVAPDAVERAIAILEEEFNMQFGTESRNEFSKFFSRVFSKYEFGRIVEFMSGWRPELVPMDEMNNPGTVKSMVLVYEGKNAVREIRQVLGPTDPHNAPGGTIRRDFGSNIMVNAVHASDSPESAAREFDIVKIHENNLSELVEEFYR